jgi:N-acetylglucosaminyl-diphospho-decaprenol L-rhamnosyltransferase
MDPTVDVIIVNWDTGRQLRDCLSALSASQRTGYVLGRVIVVDNASSDGSANGLSFPDLTLSVIQNDTNRGFAAACNQGAAESPADYLLFLNPDTAVMDDTLTRSIRWMESPENSRTGILGAQLLDVNGEVSRSCARFFATRHFISRMLGLHRLSTKRFCDYLYSDWEHLQSRYVEHVMGAYFLIRNCIFKELDGFDERFFLYLEDIDLSLRVSKAGWSSYYLTTARCYHQGGGSANRIKARRLFYTLRSRIFYGFKNFGKASAVTLLLATLFIEPISRIGSAMVRGSMIQVREVVHAYGLLWRALPSILGSQYLRKTETTRLEVEVSN